MALHSSEIGSGAAFRAPKGEGARLSLFKNMDDPTRSRQPDHKRGMPPRDKSGTNRGMPPPGKRGKPARPGTQRGTPRGGPRLGKDAKDPGGKPPTRPNEQFKTGTRLSREWLDELRDTARSGRLGQTTSLVAKALEAFAAGDYERAANLASQAKENAQRSARVRELAGLALYRASRYRDAVRELLTYRRFTGRLDQNHVIADCYRALGRPDRALEICHEVTPGKVSPEIWNEVLIVAASTLADQGDIEKALAQLARADLNPPEVEPHHLRLWYVRADLLEKAGRGKEAKAMWERISTEDPNFFDVSQRLKSARA